MVRPSRFNQTQPVQPAFGIMGTPTFVAVGGGHIRAVKLGAPSKVWLQSFLEH